MRASTARAGKARRRTRCSGRAGRTGHGQRDAAVCGESGVRGARGRDRGVRERRAVRATSRNGERQRSEEAAAAAWRRGRGARRSRAQQEQAGGVGRAVRWEGRDVVVVSAGRGGRGGRGPHRRLLRRGRRGSWATHGEEDGEATTTVMAKRTATSGDGGPGGVELSSSRSRCNRGREGGDISRERGSGGVGAT